MGSALSIEEIFFSVYSLLPTTCTICVEQRIGYDIYELNVFDQLYASRII